MEIAKKRIRIGAFLIDIFIFWSIAMIVGIFYGTPHEEGLGYSLNGFPALVMFLVGFFLWPVSEGIWGQTIGKRLLNLKVVTDDFEPIGMGQAFGRFILGFLDYIFLIGLIIAATNKQNKELVIWLLKQLL